MHDEKIELPLHILVIDDQRSMRSIMRELLHQIGVRDIATASDGEKGLEYLRRPMEDFPDLIICDLHMENMDGMEFCNAVRRDQALRNHHVPIIILTGDRDKLLHEVAQQVGAVSVVTKPITAEELKVVICEQVGFALAS